MAKLHCILLYAYNHFSKSTNYPLIFSCLGTNKMNLKGHFLIVLNFLVWSYIVYH